MTRNAGFAPTSLLFFAMGVLLLGSLFVQDVPLLVSGVRTTAVVERIDRARRRSWNLTVVFKVEGYQPVRTQIHESTVWGTSDYSVGDRVEIAYLASDPGYAEILTFHQMGNTLLMKVLFGGVALWIAYLGVIPDRR